MTGMSRMRLAAWVATGVLGGGIIAGIAVSQLGVATAASPSPSPTAPGGQWWHQRDGMHRFGGGPLARLGGRVLHGQATVQNRQGKTEVVEFQHGKVTGVTGSSVTVKSGDGFTGTYSVDKTTRIVLNGSSGPLSRVKTGDAVRVFAVKTGATATAKALVDGVPGRPFGFGHHWGPPPATTPSA